MMGIHRIFHFSVYSFLLILIEVGHSHDNGENRVTDETHDYCIIGAGPAGLQMGFFLERSGRDYLIFEKENTSGAFFVKYPRHRKMISINKRHTGKTNKEFNWRHDWNSLLSDDESLQMRHYTKEFFPHADIYVKYLNDYTRKLGLKVQYNTTVSDIQRHGPTGPIPSNHFTMRDQLGTHYACRYIIISTGISIPNIPAFEGVEHTEGYEGISLDTDEFEGQSILILGRGNSAFETADHIIGSTNQIHMFSRSRVKLAWETHYVGDLRAINNALLDTYQLKSLDGIVEGDVDSVTVQKTENGRLVLGVSDEFKYKVATDDMNISNPEDYNLVLPDNFALREPYDRVIRCLGFRFDFNIFKNDTTPESAYNAKYPKILPSYEAEGIPGLYFAGTNSHYIDHKKSAGGFIHGFRYTARALHRLLEYRNHQVPWPFIRQPITELLDHIIKRVNEASGTYQMFGVLGDAIILNREKLEYVYLEEYPLKLIHLLPETAGHKVGELIVISLEYGKNFSGAGSDIFRPDRATGDPVEAHESNFLHPVLYYYKKLPSESDMNNLMEKEVLPEPDSLHHVVEDFLTEWTAPISHILVLRRFLEDIFNIDLRYFFDHQCFQLALTYDSLPLYCQEFYMNDQGLQGDQELWTSVASMHV